MELVYCDWENLPAILAKYNDGRICGFTKYPAGWKQGQDAEIMTKAGVISEAVFKQRFPNAGMPDLPK